jgi:hypothetical protein
MARSAMILVNTDHRGSLRTPWRPDVSVVAGSKSADVTDAHRWIPRSIGGSRSLNATTLQSIETLCLNRARPPSHRQVRVQYLAMAETVPNSETFS